MVDFVTAAKRDMTIRSKAGQIIQSCPNKNYRCYAEAIHNWVAENIRYANDAQSVETLIYPSELLKMKVGDCDDQSMLVAALAESIGMPARFVTIAADSNNPSEFSHVFSQIKVSGRWMTADTTMPGHPFSWDPGPQYPRRVWAATKDASESHDGDAMAGLNVCCGDFDGAFSEAGSLCGLDDLGAQQASEESIGSVINGSYASELADRRTKLQEMTGTLFDAQQQIGNDPVLFDEWNHANGALQREKATLQKAIDAYNKYAGLIQTYSYGAYKPTQLGDLGIAPIVAYAGIAVAGGVALYLAASAFSSALGAWRGDKDATDSTFTSLRKLATESGIAIKETGSAVSSVGIVALLGFGAFILYKFLGKKGKI